MRKLGVKLAIFTVVALVMAAVYLIVSWTQVSGQ